MVFIRCCFLFLFPLALLAQNKELVDPQLIDALEIEATQNVSPNNLSFSTAKLTPEQKAGQLLIFGIHEQQFSPELKKFMKKTKIGSFVFFKRNIKSLSDFKQLLEQIRSESLANTSLLPLLAIDEEGGSVSRLPFDPKVPSANLIASTNQPELAHQVGNEIGLTLSSLGLNLNLAPVLDLGGKGSFLGTRAFSSSSKTVSRFGVEFSLGVSDAQVIPCAKHFPGMGNSTVDPHHQIGRFQFDGPNGFKKSVYPFAQFSEKIPQGAIMMSHYIYPQMDENNPAVFSIKTYKYLREKLDFDGIIITDDLQMDGIKNTTHERLPENVFRALKSGADIVMVSWSRKAQIEVHRYLAQQIRLGRLSESEVNEKLTRIARAKEWVGRSKESAARQLASENFVPDSPSHEVRMTSKAILSAKISHAWKVIRQQNGQDKMQNR